MSVLERMAGRLTQPANRIEGTFAMDNLAAVAAELERIWEMGVDFLPHRFFPTLAYGEDLTLAAANFGVVRRSAQPAEVVLTLQGVPGTVVDGEIKAAAGDVLFAMEGEAVVPESGVLTMSARALFPGSRGNVPEGSITAFVAEYPGLYRVTQPEPAFGGRDTEGDEELLARVKARWQTPSTGGNQGDYERWALAVPGVSRVKVYNPSAGNVAVYLVAEGNQEASQALCSRVWNAIDAVRPLGAHVTVASGTAVSVAVAADVKLSAGYDPVTVQAMAAQAIGAAFAKQAFCSHTVSYVKLAELLFAEGVEDVLGYTLNGGTASLSLPETAFPQLEEVLLTVDPG